MGLRVAAGVGTLRLTGPRDLNSKIPLRRFEPIVTQRKTA